MRPESILGGGQIQGDKLSRGTCPEGDNRDTPKGGVSRLSLVPSGELVPANPLLIDNAKPRREWPWEGAPRNPQVQPAFSEDSSKENGSAFITSIHGHY